MLFKIVPTTDKVIAVALSSMITLDVIENIMRFERHINFALQSSIGIVTLSYLIVKLVQRLKTKRNESN